MANGDDGYADTGGGGSVWCDFHFSEVDTAPEWREVSHAGNGHRPRKRDHDAHQLKVKVVDKYTEHKKNDDVKGHGKLTDVEHPLIKNQGRGYFVMIIDNAAQIERVELEGETLRIYLPIVDPVPAPPPGKRVRQASLRWGLRDPKLLGTSMWAALKTALLKTPGVADVTLGWSIEKHASVAGTAN